jgi:3-oxoacyl-[acyl-carrier protein] reductase
MAALPLAGRSAIVTGAYGGIGYAVASRFAREGASIMLFGRDAAKLSATTERLREDHKNGILYDGRRLQLQSHVGDVRRPEDWEALVSAIVSVLSAHPATTHQTRRLSSTAARS